MKKTLLVLSFILPLAGFAQTTSFLFNNSGNAEGWVKGQGATTLTANGTALVFTPGTVTQNFLDLNNTTNVINADTFKGLTVKVKNNSVSEDMRFRITVGTTTQFRKATLSTGNSAFQTYYLDLNQSSDTSWVNWNGNVTGQNLRFAGDGSGTASSNGWASTQSIEIDEVIFTPTATLATVEVNKSTEFITVYPNPTVDVLNLKTESRVKDVAIYSPSGTMVKGVMLNDNQIDVTKLVKGSYILKIVDEKNNTQNVKFIKK